MTPGLDGPFCWSRGVSVGEGRNSVEPSDGRRADHFAVGVDRIGPDAWGPRS
jgi:hypothetical protein